MTYTTAEQEVVGLSVVTEALGDIVNHALLQLCPVSQCPDEAEVHFQTRAHRQLFLTRILDFASERGDSALTGINGSCLDILRSACESQSFDRDGSIQGLQSATNEVGQWLATTTKLDLWLPTLGIEANLRVPRLEFLYIAGNQAKHNLSRLTRVSRKIARILEDHGYAVEPDAIPLALEDWDEHLQEDYFAYYGTWIAELLNNLRWGLQEYLDPIYREAYTKDPNHDLRYWYEYPDEISHDTPRAWFWRLMNNVRTGPYIKRFATAPYLKRGDLRD